MSVAALPGDVLGVSVVVLLLGMRHGFDADHLAAVDALTVHNATARPRLARWCGLLFSAGHGLVVVATALALSLVAETWRPPPWLGAIGAWISIVFLVLLGAVNIVAVLRTRDGEQTRIAGWRSGRFAALLRVGHPLAVMAVGALFALSFDAFSQAALFAATAAPFGGWRLALLLGGLFTVGMMATDGVNGYWLARLVRRSDRTAQVASRVMALAVAGVSLLTAGLVLATVLAPAADAWAHDRQLWFGAAIVAVLFASFRLGQRLARPTTPS